MLSRSIGILLAVMFALLLGRVEPAGAVGVGETCDGFVGIRCDAGLFCNHPAGQCHWADGQGRCVVVHAGCTREFRPVCGCNGRTYGNDCDRIRARAQLDHDGACK
jgi:hypothetical protein